MPGNDKAVARTVAVIALLVLATVAVRGYLPGVEPAPDPGEPESRGPGSPLPTLVLLALSIVIMAIGIVDRRRRRPALPRGGELPYDQRGGRFRMPWRLLLIASAVVLAWSLVLLLLMRWGSGFLLDAVPTTDTESVTAPEVGPADTAPPRDDLADAALPARPGDRDDVFGYLAAATVVLLGLSIVSTVIGRRRAPAAAPALVWPSSATDGPDLARATELGLAEIGDRSRDPREAIIACYAAMERELAKSPGTSPQDSDTPSEVLARAVERRVVQADSAAELVELFGEARFSPHVMNEGHRTDAVRALREVRRELQDAT